MRKSVIVGCCLLAASCFLSAQQKKYLDHLSDYIENTSVFGWNQEEGRAYHIPEKHISLNGDWKFFFSDTPEGIPSDFYKENFNDKAWSLIPVPSNWEMQGYGDKLFRNVHAPFKANPPFVPKEYNPTGAYRKTFTLPASWENDQVFLRLEKVASASFVWVNGQAIGYNEGAQEPAEYNITKYLKPGKNTVAIHVLKYSDGYYLEGQDYWRLAGIFDDVWLYATPSVRLFDWYVVTDLDDTYTDADLKLQVDIKKYTEEVSIDYRLKVQLWDDRKELVTELNSDPFKIESIGKKRLDLNIDCDGQLTDFKSSLFADYLSTDTTLSENTDLKQLDLQAEQLKKTLVMQKFDYLPTLSLTGLYQWSAMNNDFKFKNYRWNPYSMIGITLSVPIFSGGSKFYKVKQTKVSIDQLNLQRDDTKRNLQLAVKQYIDNMNTCIKKFDAAQKGVEQAERGYMISQKRYDTGAGTWLEMNDAELALTQARLNFNQSIYDYMVAKADLEKVLGNGQMN